jgi:ferredoxin
MRGMRVIADYVLCEANARCAQLAPEVFSVAEGQDGEDELTIAADGEVPPALEDHVRQAVNICPKMALSIEE